MRRLQAAPCLALPTALSAGLMELSIDDEAHRHPQVAGNSEPIPMAAPHALLV